MAKERERTSRLETITVEAAALPEVRWVRLLRYRSIRDQGDGSLLAWVRCAAKECGARFKLILE
ncbi:MAG: hypothetical protein IPK83_18535 [Planctomycetes bacterium]|nr:hypothetical protein [Planctomycetota bacterium]